VRIKALQRQRATFVALFVAFAATLWMAPTAHAQADVGDAADQATNTVEDTVDGTAGALGRNADTATETEEGPIKDTTDTVADEIDDATGGESKPVTDQVRKVGSETLAPVDDVIEDTLGGADERDPAVNSGGTDGLLDGSGGNRTDDSGISGARVRGTRIGRSVETRRSSNRGDVLIPSTQLDTSTGDSLADQATRIAQKIAFPLVLLILVAAFLLLQSRLDKKDPKLALAPVDADDQYLTFR
jgi:hypothetical protein